MSIKTIALLRTVKTPASLVELSSYSSPVADLASKRLFVVYPQALLEIDYANFGSQRLLADLSAQGNGTGPEALTMRGPVLDAAHNRIFAFWGPQLAPNTVLSMDTTSGKVFKLAEMPLPGNWSFLAAGWDATSNTIRLIGKSKGFPPKYNYFAWNPDTAALSGGPEFSMDTFLSVAFLNYVYQDGVFLMSVAQGRLIRINTNGNGPIVQITPIDSIKRWQSLLFL